MKKLGVRIILIFLVVVVGVGYFKIKGTKKSVIKENRPVHPYAIESLNSHVMPSKITIEKKFFDQPFGSYLISFKSENIKEFALMNIPSGTKPETGWPVVVLNHGFVAPKYYSTTESYKHTAAYFASKGFLVLKADYRGHDKSEGTIDSLYSRNQYAVDVLNLMAAIDSIPEADVNKIFVYGHSMGGDISLMVAESSDKIKKMVVWAPAVTSYPQNLIFFTKRHGDGLDKPEAQKELATLMGVYGAESFSSFSNVNKINVPMIVQQSITDESVPYEWSQQLVEKLKESGKEVTSYSYPNDNHDIAKHWYEALDKDISFFRQ